MARPSKKDAATSPPAKEAPVLDIKAITTPATPVTLGDSLVEVAYFDGSKFTFDLHLNEGIARFVEGVAVVTPALALVLKDRGYIKE